VVPWAEENDNCEEGSEEGWRSKQTVGYDVLGGKDRQKISRLKKRLKFCLFIIRDIDIGRLVFIYIYKSPSQYTIKVRSY